MNYTAKARFRAAIVAVAPAVMLVGFLYHPFIANLPDTEAVAAAAGQDMFRWAVAHLLIAIGSGLIAVAFLAVRAWLREAGEDRWSAVAVPFTVMAGALYAILPGMEFSVLAAIETGGDPAAAQAAIDPWFLPLLLTAAATFAIGAFGFALAIVRSGVLTQRHTVIVAGALIVMGVARFVPLGLVQFYVNGLAGLVALWPLAHEMWRQPARGTGEHARSFQAG
jgi:hypothetical protein